MHSCISNSVTKTIFQALHHQETVHEQKGCLPNEVSKIHPRHANPHIQVSQSSSFLVNNLAFAGRRDHFHQDYTLRKIHQEILHDALQERVVQMQS